jgi:prepilin-type N-terminal cleavage/methylation domain-containing protein
MRERNNRKILQTEVVSPAAFTLVETLIVLIISGLLLGILYVSLRAVEHRYQIFLTDSRRQAEISSLRALLNYDSEQSQLCTREGNRFSAHFLGYKVTYVFFDNMVLRNQQTVSDTFRLAVDSLSFSWQDKPMTKPVGPVDELAFVIRIQSETYVFYQRKTYDQATLWKMEKQYSR